VTNLKLERIVPADGLRSKNMCIFYISYILLDVAV
jgi:hypothetical protein